MLQNPDSNFIAALDNHDNENEKNEQCIATLLLEDFQLVLSNKEVI
jgi:hypothetical protein